MLLRPEGSVEGRGFRKLVFCRWRSLTRRHIIPTINITPKNYCDPCGFRQESANKLVIRLLFGAIKVKL